jgi:hypothetical protein
MVGVGHEDLRQDERVMQLFGLMNTLLANDKESFTRLLHIQRFPVIPLAPNAGLIGWVQGSDTLHVLVRDYRDSRKVLLNIEYRLMLQVLDSCLSFGLTISSPSRWPQTTRTSPSSKKSKCSNMRSKTPQGKISIASCGSNPTTLSTGLNVDVATPVLSLLTQWLGISLGWVIDIRAICYWRGVPARWYISTLVIASR